MLGDKADLYKPDSQEFCKAFQEALNKHFKHASVEEVDCPNLTEAPWNLASEGICGSPKLLDVGGVPYLMPTPDLKRIYNFDQIADHIGMAHECFFIGAGAAGAHILGHNAEMMANLRTGHHEKVGTRIAKVNEYGNCELQEFPHKEFCLLGNFLASEGKPGKVFKIVGNGRLGEENFITKMRLTLEEYWPRESIGMGGVFLIKRGLTKLHVMPDFSKTPITTNAQVDEWLNFYEMHAPLVCLSTFVAHDPGLDLRVEHTHCFSEHNEGGHYHYDTTPEEVEYEGYFVFADSVEHIDRPTKTHMVGRD